MSYRNIVVPAEGQVISLNSDGSLNVPARPIVPFIEGDGIGVDITPVMQQVVDAAVEQAYGGKYQLVWMEVYAGAKAAALYGADQYLPDETIRAFRDFHIGIKGPLATPVAGGIRSLNVALRQQLDLYVCQRPVRWVPGVPAPVKHPEQVDMVVFRENTEDIYAGIEWRAGSEQADRLIALLKSEFDVNQFRFDQQCGIGIKPVSEEGSKRLIRKALQYCIDSDRDSLTLVHKGNIMKFTEGAFREWGYEVAYEEFAAQPVVNSDHFCIENPSTGRPIVIKDVIADSMLQQVLLRPAEYDVIATLNLNGDYLSDAIAAQVGGIGMAPGANISDDVAIFEATHGSAPGYAGQDKVNPGSLILSAKMMLEHLGWWDAAKLIDLALEGVISKGEVTYDLARLLPGSTKVSCSDFGRRIVEIIRAG